jgi:hypothetical protein
MEVLVFVVLGFIKKLKKLLNVNFYVLIMRKSKVPQINEKTGISADYINAFMALKMDIEFDLPEEEIEKYVLKYTDHFNRYPVDYEDLITDKNRDSIKKLDTIVERINALLLLEKKPYEEILRLCYEAQKIIYG